MSAAKRLAATAAVIGVLALVTNMDGTTATAPSDAATASEVLRHDDATPPPARPVEAQPKPLRVPSHVKRSVMEACDSVVGGVFKFQASPAFFGLEIDATPAGDVIVRQVWNVQNAFGATREVPVTCIYNSNTDTWTSITVGGKALAL